MVLIQARESTEKKKEARKISPLINPQHPDSYPHTVASHDVCRQFLLSLDAHALPPVKRWGLFP